MAPGQPAAPPPQGDVAYWRGFERTLILLRFLAMAFFVPVILVEPNLEWPAAMTFALVYNVGLVFLLPRVHVTFLALAAIALDMLAITGLLAALNSGPPYTSLLLVVIVHAAGRFQMVGALGSWAAVTLAHLGLMAIGQIPTARPYGWVFQEALWLIIGVIVGEISRRLRQSRETALLAGELQASRAEVERGRERAEAALAGERRQRELAETLQTLALELNGELDEQRLLERTLELASRIVPCTSGVVWVVEGEQGYLAAVRGQLRAADLGRRRDLSQFPLVRHLVETRQPLRLAHMQAYPEYVGHFDYEEPLSYVGVPLLAGGQVMGILSLRSPGIGVYDEEHEGALVTFAAQAALALRNARLIAQERRQRELAETLQQLTLELNAELDEQRILGRTLDLALRVVPGHSGVVWLLEGDSARLAAAWGQEPGLLAVGTVRPVAEMGLLRAVLEGQSPLRLDDMQADPRYTFHTVRYDEPQSYLGVRLLAGPQTVGALSVRERGIGAYTEEHEQTLAAFASQAAVALYNARLMDAAELHATEEETLARAVAAIAAGVSLPEACNALLRELRGLLPFDRASVALVEPGDMIRLVAVSGPQETAFPSGSLMPLAETPNAAVLSDLRTRVMSDLAQEATTPFGRKLAAEGYRSIVMVPFVTFEPGSSHGEARRVAMGSLSVASREPARYGSAEAALLERIATRLAGALSTARLREERDRAAARIALLQRLTAVVNRTIELRRVFGEIARELRRTVPFDRLTLFLLQGGGDVLRYAVWGRPGPAVEGTTLPLEGSGLLGQVLASGQPASRADIAAEARGPIDRDLVERGLRSDALLPLVAGGRTLGALALGSRSPGAFSADHLELLGPVAEQLALAVDRSLAHQRVVEQATRLEAVNRVARLVAEGLDLRHTFGAFAAALRPMVGHDRATLYVLRPGASELEWLEEAAPGAEEVSIGSAQASSFEGSAAGWVLQERRPLLRPDIGAEAAAGGFPSDARTLASGIRSSAALPLVVGDQAVGVLILASRARGAFQEAHLLLLRPLADQLALALQNALLHEKTHTQAMTDPLTGLPNRRQFDQRLEPELQRARRLGYPLSFLFVDMDDFKEINDTLGHQAGDAALRQAGEALAASLRGSDFLARWGGDEFVVLLPGVGPEELPVVAEKLQRTLASLPPYVPAAAGSALAASMGGAIFPRDGDTAERLVEAADRALLAAKALGGRRLRIAVAGANPTP